jgi:hypothetical protein
MLAKVEFGPDEHRVAANESESAFPNGFFGPVAAHDVTQKPTAPINQGFVTTTCKFFFHESAR